MDRKVGNLLGSATAKEEPSENLDNLQVSSDLIDMNDVFLPLSESLETEDFPDLRTNMFVDQELVVFQDPDQIKWDDLSLIGPSTQERMTSDIFNDDYPGTEYPNVIENVAAGTAMTPELIGEPSRPLQNLIPILAMRPTAALTDTEPQQQVKMQPASLNGVKRGPPPQFRVSEYEGMIVPLSLAPVGVDAEIIDIAVGSMGRAKRIKLEIKDLVVAKPVKEKRKGRKQGGLHQRHGSDAAHVVATPRKTEPKTGYPRDPSSPEPSAAAVMTPSAGITLLERNPKIFKKPRPRRQPSLRRSVPEDEKGAEYFAHRKKNTEAARACREKKRLLDVERVALINGLIAENARMREEIKAMKKVLADLKKQLQELDNETNE